MSGWGDMGGRAVIHDTLRFRVWVDGELVREDWLPGITPIVGADLARQHAAVASLAQDSGKTWLVEVYDPDAPADEGYLRFGSDTEGMVCPCAVVLIGSDDVDT
jgi:hypothetical protein